jgi:hypothetical protein
MDFSVVVLSAEDEEFRRRARSFLAENVSEEALAGNTKSVPG